MSNKGLITCFRDDEEQSFVERNLLKLKNALENKVRILIERFKALPDSAKVVYILQKILLLLGDARFVYLVFYKYNFVIMYKKYVKALKSHVLESASMKEMLSDLAQVAFFTTYHKFVSALGDKVIKHIVKKHKKQRGDSAMKNKLITHDSMPWTKYMARKNYFIDAPDKAAVSKSIKKLEQIESQADAKQKETKDSLFSRIKSTARKLINLLKGGKGIKVIAVVASTAILGSLVAAAYAKYKGDKTVNSINSTAKEAQEAVNKTVENINKTQEEVNKAAQEFAERMNNSKSKTDSIKRYIDAKVEREVRRRFYDANIEDIKAKLVSAGQKLKQTGSATADKTVQKIKSVLQLIKNNPGKAAAIGAGLAAIVGAAAFGAKRAKDRKEAMLQKVLIDYCNNASKNIRFGLPAQDLPDDKIRQANSALHHSEAENRRLYEQYKNSKHDSFFLDIDRGGLLDKLRKKASAALQSFKEMNAPQKVITAVEAILHATFIMRQLQNEVDDVKWKRTLNSLNNAYQQTRSAYNWLGAMEDATNTENNITNMRLILRPIIVILRTILLHKGANWLRKKAA